jgi:hypothetical protein
MWLADTLDSPCASLRDELPDHRNQFDGDIHRGMRRRLVSRLILSDGFIIGLSFVVLENTTNALFVPGGYFAWLIPSFVADAVWPTHVPLHQLIGSPHPPGGGTSGRA